MPAPDPREIERNRLREQALELRRELLRRFGDVADDRAWVDEPRPDTPAVPPAGTGSRIDRLMEQDRLALPPAPGSTPVTAGDARGGPSRSGEDQRVLSRVRRFGFESIFRALQDHDPNALDVALRRLEAVIEVWGRNRPGSLDEGSLKLVHERRDDAALHASSVFYGLAYRAGVPDAQVSDAAESLALSLNAELYGGNPRLRRIRGGKFDHSRHNCLTPVQPGGRVRPITFEIVSADGAERIERKALVEVIPTGGVS